MGFAGHVVHSGVSRARNSDALFSCSVGTGTDSTRIAMGHVTSNLCFLHLVGSVGHVVHSGAFRARKVDALFFML
jgi:hypothetical protein